MVCRGVVGLGYSFTLEHRAPLPAGLATPLLALSAQVTAWLLAPHPQGCLLTLQLALRLRGARGRHTLRLALERVLAEAPEQSAGWTAQVLGWHLETTAGGRVLAAGLRLSARPCRATAVAVLGATAAVAELSTEALAGAVLAAGRLTAAVTWTDAGGGVRCSEAGTAWSCLLPAPGCAPGDRAELAAAVAALPWHWAPGSPAVALRAALALHALVLRRESAHDARGELLLQRVVGRPQGGAMVSLAIPLG